MLSEEVDRTVTCPACARSGRLKGTLTVSKTTGDWMSFVPEALPAGFVLVTNARIRLICLCDTVAWPLASPG
jgi:hypothetical protein